MGRSTPELLNGIAELNVILQSEHELLKAGPSNADFSGTLAKLDQIEKNALQPSHTKLAKSLQALREKLSSTSSEADRKLIPSNLQEIMFETRTIGLEANPEVIDRLKTYGLGNQP